MKFATTTALAGALALGIAGMTASPALAKKKEEAAQQGAQFSTAFRQAAQPVQKAMQAGDYAGAKAALPALLQAASTPDDKYQGYLIQLQIALKENDAATQNSAIDQILATGKATPEVTKQILNVRGVNAFNSNDLATADKAFTQLVQLNPQDGDTAILLAQTKLREKQPQAALPVVDQAIQAKKASGQPVPEDWYRRALAIAYDGKMPAETVKYGQQLISAYPSPAAWRTVLQTYRDTNRLDQQTDLDTLRLMRATGGLAGERDYFEYANLANDKGFPGEAKAVIDEGMASNMVDNQALKNSKVLNEIKNLAAPKVAADKASLPALDKAARAGADGKKALNTADAYLGYGMYAQAADLYKIALSKGGVDPNIVNLRLGMALARAGQKDAAVQALNAVTGPRQALAQYWVIYANVGQGSATAAPAPAAG
ncbi:tetratricopeptide repeat protein [Sphingomonas morindae]|uniref:Tetratricopeptide repeat protein n=1 Tax=Sphingomonas morindae TaxID=1541170 RepID=A0ABY4X7T2_9SPHN|nr:hypothetical protein [Sphingomonas morindae]USI72976.1 hypothetical protein LHA26_00405 [Sphingomonas morindae]